MTLLWILFASLVPCIWRVYSILPSVQKRRPPATDVERRSQSLAIFLGSGGHSSEGLLLLSSLDFTRYFPRTYIISEGDLLSEQKAVSLESSKKPTSLKSIHINKSNVYNIVTIPRARKVHQHLLSTIPSVIRSLLSCISLITIHPLRIARWSLNAKFADVLILNGPGTCVILCIAVYINKFFGLPAPRLVYVESFARVKSLSLSGKLLRPFVDRFVVQWPQLVNNHGQNEYYGWLV